MNDILLTDQISVFNVTYHPELVPRSENHTKEKIEREILPKSPDCNNNLENLRVPIAYKIGESYSVYITHVENLQNFYVIHVVDYLRYPDLKNTLKNIPLNPITQDPIIDEKYLITAGKIDSSDFAAHRVIVKNIDKKSKCVRVFFLDEGLTDFVSFDLLFELPHELKAFSNYDPYVTKFSLFKADAFTAHLNENEQKYYFEYHTKNIQLSLKVEDEGEINFNEIF